MAGSDSLSRMRDRLVAGGRGQDLHTSALQHARQREDVPRVVVDQQHGLADQILVGTVQELQHPLLVGRQVGHHAMQEQRRLVEQTLRRFHALDDDAARHGVQPRVLLGRQFLAGEHHDRNIGERRVAPHLVEHLEAGHVRQPQIEHHAIARILAQRGQRVAAGRGIDDLDVVVTEQRVDAHPLGGVVLDHQEPAPPRLGEVLDPGRARPKCLPASSA